jgi:hypothetical protein
MDLRGEIGTSASTLLLGTETVFDSREDIGASDFDFVASQLSMKGNLPASPARSLKDHHVMRRFRTLSVIAVLR